jgi:L-ascorbate metabolism protein UlaG (beta-lactamase superfamily)
MVIEWLGHSCFKITFKNGTRVLFDPFDEESGYGQLDVETDIVAVSHPHHDHSDLSGVKGTYTLVNTPGVHNIDGLTIEGISTWHDHSEGRERGANLVFVIKSPTITVCHMGDLGSLPPDDVFEKLKGVDVLMLPVGGVYTINAKEALEICSRLEPNIIIPMHYKTSVCTVKLEPVDFFLEAVGREFDISRLGKNTFEIDRDSLKKRSRIVVMEYM